MSDTKRLRVGRLVLDEDVTEDERNSIIRAIGRETELSAKTATSTRIDVFRWVDTDTKQREESER